MSTCENVFNKSVLDGFSTPLNSQLTGTIIRHVVPPTPKFVSPHLKTTKSTLDFARNANTPRPEIQTRLVYFSSGFSSALSRDNPHRGAFSFNLPGKYLPRFLVPARVM